MPKVPSIAFLIVGVILLGFGLNAANSVSSEVSEVVSGAPTDKSIWLIVLGVIGIVSGGLGLLLGRRS